MLKRVMSLGFIAVLAVILAGSTSFKPGIADTGYALQGQNGDKHGRSLALFEIAGVYWTDIDEPTDFLVVGVANEGVAKEAKKKAEEVGIDPATVRTVIAQPIEPVQTLRDKAPSLQGGLQVAFSVYVCTLGFNAVRSGFNGFVVASHCTDKYGGIGKNPTKHYQPTVADDNFIGTEKVDPNFSKCQWVNVVCRWSDSAWDELASGVSAALGFIERAENPNNPGPNTVSLNINGSFRIVGEALTNAPVGEILNKVGRTTGWTQGPVTQSCVHTRVFGTNKVLLCQDFVQAGVAGGDSGSPVFRITNSPNLGDVELSGILWGGNGDGTTFVYSPIANVQRDDELGPLTTCAPGPDGTSPC